MLTGKSPAGDPELSNRLCADEQTGIATAINIPRINGLIMKK
jgi:hypothetical protein